MPQGRSQYCFTTESVESNLNVRHSDTKVYNKDSLRHRIVIIVCSFNHYFKFIQKNIQEYCTSLLKVMCMPMCLVELYVLVSFLEESLQFVILSACGYIATSRFALKPSCSSNPLDYTQSHFQRNTSIFEYTLSHFESMDYFQKN